MTAPRGELLGTLRVAQPDWLPGIIALVFGGGMVSAALVPDGFEGSAVEEIAVRAIAVLAGGLFIVLGVASIVRTIRQRLLVFENGLVFRNWRGEERFIPWDRLDAVDIRVTMIGLFTPYRAAAFLEVAGERGPEEIHLGWDNVGLFSHLPDKLDELAEVLARHTDLRYRPGGSLLVDAPRWDRAPEEAHPP